MNKQQQQAEKPQKEINPLICDPVKGVCELPGSQAGNDAIIKRIETPLQIIYFTDPICSTCWGIEPQLRKLKMEYGNAISIEYRMGGLLPDWTYNSGGISKPSDVAYHWDEVSLYYDMPIDGDIWLEDPLYSSYPPSIAFKAATLQGGDKAIRFLREMREMVFLHKKNITQWQHIEEAANLSGLDANLLKADFNGNAKALFEKDLMLTREWGVRGFPTIFLIDNLGNKEVIYGYNPYSAFEIAIQNLNPLLHKINYNKDWQTLFSKFHSLTSREFTELSEIPKDESEKKLNELWEKGLLEKFTSKNGAIFRKK